MSATRFLPLNTTLRKIFTTIWHHVDSEHMNRMSPVYRTFGLYLRAFPIAPLLTESSPTSFIEPPTSSVPIKYLD